MDLSRQTGRLDHHEILRARQSLLSNSGNGRDGTQCSRDGHGNENSSGLRHAGSHLIGVTFYLQPARAIDGTPARPFTGASSFNHLVGTGERGTSSPSVFAVLRLTARRNLVGRFTGKPAGFSPLRILPA
jgi:hypothetical protein